jgi:hypothetical protein
MVPHCRWSPFLLKSAQNDLACSTMVLSTNSGTSEKFREIQKTPLAKIGKKWRWSRTSAASYLQYLNPSMSAAQAESIHPLPVHGSRALWSGPLRYGIWTFRLLIVRFIFANTPLPNSACVTTPTLFNWMSCNY